MIKELMHDPIFLAKKSEPASSEDLQTAYDLMDTLMAHKEECVGMAANMIGVSKCIIAFCDGDNYTIMLNPEILKKEQPYDTEEGCLSLFGGPRRVTRYKKIKVKFQTTDLQTRIKTYTGFSAQIIQHETDHCNSVLI